LVNLTITIKKGLKTICYTYGANKRMINVRYTVKGKAYIATVGRGFGKIQDGEAFVLMYLDSDPSSIFVLFDKPVLSDKYEYTETKCTHLVKTMPGITYHYYDTKGKLIKRNAKYIDNQSLNLNDYIVRYRSENSRIGYLVKK
jgi:hypothetical protein